MAKKDFSNVKAGRVYEAMAEATKDPEKRAQQITAAPAEVEERRAALHTQGRKGAKATRINMAFTPDNHDFIKTVARATGKTMTEFTNIVIERYRTEHPEIYEQAKALRDIL